MAEARDRSHLTQMRFKLPAGCKDREGVRITSIVMREIDTDDALAAGKLADANKTPLDRELLAMSVVSVNGDHFSGSVDGWNSKAFECLGRIFAKLNGLPPGEAEELEKSGEVVGEARPA